MFHSRMFWRLFCVYGVVLLTALGLLGAVLSSRVERYQRDQIADRLRIKAILIREAVRNWPADQHAKLQERIGVLGPEIGARITLIDEKGEVLADSDENPARMDNHVDRPEVKEARHTTFGTATRRSDTLGKDLMYVAQYAPRQASGIATVRVAVPLDQVYEQLAGLRGVVWSAAAVTGLVGTMLAFWLSRRIARPLQELTRGAERIAAAEFGCKVYVDSQDEFGLLARTFNNMSQRLAEQFTQLGEDRQQLRTILSGMQEGVIALDREERILFANERAAAFLGFQIESAVDRKLWEMVRHRSIHDVVRRVLSGEAACRGEMELDGPGGKFLLIQGVRLPGPSLRGAVLVLHDMTEVRRLERVRQEFVANVSHELKTPLSVIKACIETLLDGAVEDSAHRGRFLQQIAEQAEHLHALILDLLSLAKIESGSASYEFEPVDLVKAIADCLEQHGPRAVGKQQILEAGFGTNGFAAKQPDGRTSALSSPPVAWADAEAVSQILENLVDNALKYTPEGGRIWVRCQGDADQVLLEVEDTGIGIPERDLPRIFERFYRVDKARSRELGGTGLGLSIVKHLVQAMHGNVRATSRLGKGTTFEVRLPRAPT